jgi:hypothetical protein
MLHHPGVFQKKDAVAVVVAFALLLWIDLLLEPVEAQASVGASKTEAVGDDAVHLHNVVCMRKFHWSCVCQSYIKSCACFRCVGMHVYIYSDTKSRANVSGAVLRFSCHQCISHFDTMYRICCKLFDATMITNVVADEDEYNTPCRRSAPE